MKGFKIVVFSLLMTMCSVLFSQDNKQENNRIFNSPSSTEQYSKYIALVGDLDTCTEIMEDLKAYSDAIATKDYGVHLLCDIWSDADVLRLELAYLKDKYNIEGAILFGNIPKVSISFNMQSSYVDTDFYYQNFNNNYMKQSKIGNVAYYRLLNNIDTSYKRDIYTSRIFGKKDDIENIRSYFKRITENYVNENPKIVNRVVGIIGNNFFNGSKYAALSDADVWKQTISLFYPNSNDSVVYLFSKDFQTNKEVLSKVDNDILLLLFNGDKKDYLSSINSKLVISTELPSDSLQQMYNMHASSLIVLPQRVSSENIVPANYHLLFTGQNIGIYFKNLPYVDAKLIGDPIFSFAKSNKVSLDVNKEGNRLSRLLLTIKILSQYKKNIPENIISSLLLDNDEKIRFEAVNWIKNNAPLMIFSFSDNVKLDSSDRVFKTCIDAIVLSSNSKARNILDSIKRYYRNQGDDLRQGIVDDGIFRLTSRR